jgi:ribosomal protein L11 methyltransferase
VIDPGRAFGTGAHPTTQLCLQLLIDVADHGSVLDIGCGSGVLAIAASKLGFEPVIALDHDPITLEAAATNARANDVTIDLRLIEALEDELPEANTAVANISATAIETVAGRVRATRLITSGYLASERPEAERYRLVERRELDGWAADLWSAPE